MRAALIPALLLCLALTAVPAMAQTVYSNGAINGETDAWVVANGGVVSDTFAVSSATTVNGLVFGAWAFPGDVLESAVVSITSSEFGGTTYFSGTVSFTQASCFVNQYGYNVCTETASFLNGPFLNSGTYWLSLENAVVNTGDPIYWDENSGPSSAWQCCAPEPWLTNTVGTIPSEAFTLLGQGTTCGDGPGCTPSQTVPEPAGLASLGAAGLTLFGFLNGRRRSQS